MKRNRPKAKASKPSRATQRSKSAERTFPAHACEVCGLTEFDSPVGTRWVQGHALELCQGCWRAPRSEDAEKIAALVEERSAASTRGAQLDRQEGALDLAGAASMHYAEWLHADHLKIEDACREMKRIGELTKWEFPLRFRIRAARAAFRRGLIPLVEEDHPAVTPFADLERDAFERALFSGFCKAWGVPSELHDWVFDSARAGNWIPVTATGGQHRIEPRVGAYLDHDRWQSPPCVTWGRHSSGKDRGDGTWAVALNRKKGWDKAKKAIRDVQLADPKEQALYRALIAEVNERHGLPSDPPDEKFGDLDREELKYRLHVRMCDLCRGKDGESVPRERSRGTHLFRCVDAKGAEGDPKMSWLGDQLDRPWNQQLLFNASMAFPGHVRTS